MDAQSIMLAGLKAGGHLVLIGFIKYIG